MARLLNSTHSRARRLVAILCILMLCVSVVAPVGIVAAANLMPPDLVAAASPVAGYPITVGTNNTAWVNSVTSVLADGSSVTFTRQTQTIQIKALAAGAHTIVFKATGYDDATLTVTVTPDNGPVVFTITNAMVSPAKKITFTEKGLRALTASDGITANYSSYNTFPTFKYAEDVTGIPLTTLVSRLGALSIGDTNLIEFKGADGFTGSFTYKELFKDQRFCFPDGKTTANKQPVIPIINFLSEDRGKLFYGQLVPNEQTNDSFVKELLGGSMTITSKKAAPLAPITQASHASGSTVAVGQKISFTLPPSNGRAKVYFTTDGSTPTISSTMYNVTADSWIGMVDNPITYPVLNKEGTVTIKVIVIGRGALPSPVTSFTYKVTTGGVPVDPVDPSKPVDPVKPVDPTPPAGKPVLTVVDAKTGRTTKLTDTDFATVAKAEGNKTYTYSAYNTFPSVKGMTAKGPTVKGLIAKAGIADVAANRLVKVQSSDGFTTKMTYGDMTTGRYYFPNGTKGTANGAVGGADARAGWTPVPSIIAPTVENGRFAIGQRQPNDQTFDAFAKNMIGGTITIEAGGPSALPSITKSTPQTTELVKPGDQIKFLLPMEVGRAKVYYTTDGTTPTETSTMYNRSAWKQAGGPEDNFPVIKHSGKTTIKVVVIGRGFTPSTVTEFTFSTDPKDLPAGAASAETSAGAAGLTDQGPAMPGASDESGIEKLLSDVFGADAPKILGINWIMFLIIVVVSLALGAGIASFVVYKVLKKRWVPGATEGEPPTGGGPGSLGPATATMVLLVMVCALGGALLSGCSSPATDDQKADNSGVEQGAQTTAHVPEDISLEIVGMSADRMLDAQKLDSYKKSSGVYTSVNNWPTNKTYSAEGIDLKALLDDLGVTPKTITFESSDGYHATLTYDELMADRYSFYKDKKEKVEPILAFSFAEGDSLKDASQNGLTLVFGQELENEHSNPAFVETVTKVILSDEDPKPWDPPKIFPATATVQKGGTVKLTHPDSGLLKIYYTTDGTEPDMTSSMYNPSTYQPELNKPIPVDKDTQIKAIAIGYGRPPSTVATFDVKVK